MCEYYLELARDWQRLSQRVGEDATRELLRNKRTSVGLPEGDIRKAEREALGEQYPAYKQFMGVR